MMGEKVFQKLWAGCVIPAHPLALTADKKLDERHQRALTRYYLAAGAGGLAVGVHTTQFAIHDPKVGLYGAVLELAAETAKRAVGPDEGAAPVMIAGLVGQTRQAVREAELAQQMGYHLGLLSLTALKGKSTDELLGHTRQVADVIPIMGFYLQPAISRMVLPREFWGRFVEIPNVRAIKIAPFNRYQSLDVLEAVACSGRSAEIALYTGNDDNILVDLLTRHTFAVGGEQVCVPVAGGLLGQWACWTKRAVEHLETVQKLRAADAPVPQELLALAGQLTLANRAIFDPGNDFAGCISGILHVLKQQGLVDRVVSLDPHDRLSPGQTEEIDRIIRDYPHLTDDEFVKANLDRWLAP